MYMFSKSYEVLNNMINLLLSNVVGRMYLYNGYYSDSYDLIGRSYIRSYIEKCCDYFNRIDGCTFQELYKVLHKVAMGYKIDDASMISYFLLGKSECSDFNQRGDIKISNIINYRVYSEFFLDVLKIHEGHHYLDGIPEYCDYENIRYICSLLKEKNIYKDGAMLGGLKERPMFWVTLTMNIDRHRKIGVSCMGDKVRDKLGLAACRN